MQTLTEKVYRLAPPGGIFDESVVRNLLPGSSDAALKQYLHRAMSKGEVHRLKRGLYCLAEPYRKTDPHPFIVAALLHSPSHISLESALSYHGLIPEAVHGVTSVTACRGRKFMTPLGDFNFQRVPADEPRAGVRPIKLDEQGWAFIAGPLRAMADLIYLRKEITWKKDGLMFLKESMRMDEDDLRGMPLDDYEEIFRSLRNKRTKMYLKGLKEELEQ